MATIDLTAHLLDRNGDPLQDFRRMPEEGKPPEFVDITFRHAIFAALDRVQPGDEKLTEFEKLQIHRIGARIGVAESTVELDAQEVDIVLKRALPIFNGHGFGQLVEAMDITRLTKVDEAAKACAEAVEQAKAGDVSRLVSAVQALVAAMGEGEAGQGDDVDADAPPTESEQPPPT